MRYPTTADIAEMKARQYDIHAIDEARERAKRQPRADEIRRLIEISFASVTLGNGVGLREALAIDDYAGPKERAAIRAKDEQDDWRRVTIAAMNYTSSNFSFFDAEGTRFHLPAFLIAELNGDYEHGLEFHLTHLDHRTIKKFALLNDVQHNAVREFLLHMADEPDYNRENVLRALREYWVMRPDDLHQ